MRIPLALAVIVMLAGCATPTYNYQPKSVDISEPPIGAVASVRIGDVMLRQGKYREHEALQLNATASVGFAYTLYPGYYLKTGEDAEAEFFFPGREDNGGRVEKTPFADPWKAVMLKRRGSANLCVVTVFNLVTCTDAPGIEKTRKPVLAQDAFQQTLIYNGRVGNKINVGYREFSNNYARPAFSNNVEYDLSDSPKIGYKGAEIEVLEATNQHIKFRMLHNFNDAR